MLQQIEDGQPILRILRQELLNDFKTLDADIRHFDDRRDIRAALSL